MSIIITDLRSKILRMKKDKYKYKSIWLVFVNIVPEPNYQFDDLIDNEANDLQKYVGAWANILVKAQTIDEALKIAPVGLRELKFEIEFVEKIENFQSLVDYNEANTEIIKEADWLLKSKYKFKISDRLFPYL